MPPRDALRPFRNLLALQYWDDGLVCQQAAAGSNDALSKEYYRSSAVRGSCPPATRNTSRFVSRKVDNTKADCRLLHLPLRQRQCGHVPPSRPYNWKRYRHKADRLPFLAAPPT